MCEERLYVSRYSKCSIHTFSSCPCSTHCTTNCIITN